MFKILSIILKKQKYISIMIAVSLVAILVSYYLTVVNVYENSILRYASMAGLWFTIISLLLSLAISLFFGAYVSLLVFKRDIARAKSEKINKITSSVGGVIGAAATGCPTCGTPLLALVGIPFGLMSLPFRGLELKILSVVLLYWSIMFLSKNIIKNLSCDLQAVKKAD